MTKTNWQDIEVGHLVWVTTREHDGLVSWAGVVNFSRMEEDQEVRSFSLSPLWLGGEQQFGGGIPSSANFYPSSDSVLDWGVFQAVGGRDEALAEMSSRVQDGKPVLGERVVTGDSPEVGQWFECSVNGQDWTGLVHAVSGSIVTLAGVHPYNYAVVDLDNVDNWFAGVEPEQPQDLGGAFAHHSASNPAASFAVDSPEYQEYLKQTIQNHRDYEEGVLSEKLFDAFIAALQVNREAIMESFVAPVVDGLPKLWAMWPRPDSVPNSEAYKETPSQRAGVPEPEDWKPDAYVAEDGTMTTSGSGFYDRHFGGESSGEVEITDRVIGRPAPSSAKLRQLLLGGDMSGEPEATERVFDLIFGDDDVDFLSSTDLCGMQFGGEVPVVIDTSDRPVASADAEPLPTSDTETKAKEMVASGLFTREEVVANLRKGGAGHIPAIPIRSNGKLSLRSGQSPMVRARELFALLRRGGK